MTAEEIMNSENFRRVVDFHGHVCPGVAIGYRAAAIALEKLAAERSEDEELVAIVENDACGVDAVQVLTGCTFGKGNFFFRDYGKQVFSFLCRKTGRGIRVSLRPDALSAENVDQKIFDRVRAGKASEEELSIFHNSRKRKLEKILSAPEDELFSISELKMEPPARASVMASALCPECGEPVMPTKFEIVNGKNICRSCASLNP